MDSMALQIQQKLQELQPVHLDIINESHMHSGPATDSHYKLTIVSDAFAELRPVARHQLIYRILANELAGAVHALALHTFAPSEWSDQSTVPASPNCQSKKKPVG